MIWILDTQQKSILFFIDLLSGLKGRFIHHNLRYMTLINYFYLITG